MGHGIYTDKISVTHCLSVFLSVCLSLSVSLSLSLSLQLWGLERRVSRVAAWTRIEQATSVPSAECSAVSRSTDRWRLVLQTLWNGLYLRGQINPGPQDEAWTEITKIRQYDKELSSKVNKLRRWTPPSVSGEHGKGFVTHLISLRAFLARDTEQTIALNSGMHDLILGVMLP